MICTFNMEGSWKLDIEFLRNASNDMVSPKIESLTGPFPLKNCGEVESCMDRLGPYNDPSSPDHKEAVKLFCKYDLDPV